MCYDKSASLALLSFRGEISMSEKRRDNRNRILREGEYQRKEMRIKVDDLRRNTGLMRSYKKMTKILFVCHGKIHTKL